MRALRRLLTFIASRLLALTIVFSLLVISFYLAMNTANIWVLIDEGLDLRAGVVLTGSKEDDLTKYFSQEFLNQDPVLQVVRGGNSPYVDYDVRSYDHRIRVNSIWSWPWETVARADITENIPSIEGSIKSAKREAALAAGGESRLKPPAWESARYRVTLVRSAGRWKITNMQVIQQK